MNTEKQILVAIDASNRQIDYFTKEDIPANFEGRKSAQEYDSIIILPDDMLKAQAINELSSIVHSNGDDDINLDILDLKTVLNHNDIAFMGEGLYEGTNAASKAMGFAIENIPIKGAMSILVHFYIHPNFPMKELTCAMEMIHDNTHRDADVIFGTTTDVTVAENYVKITIIAQLEKELNPVKKGKI